MLKAFFITLGTSMVPILELRGGIPVGIAAGLSWEMAMLAAVIGNLIPVPFIIIFIRKIFAFMRRHIPKLGTLVDSLERRAKAKGELVHRYELLGLIILVAVPLPGTGAWTGSLVAALLDIRLRRALPCIVAGVLIAAAVVTAACLGVVHIAGL